MLKRMYLQSKAFFQDDAIDFDDFLQEMWCQLFEEKRFMPDRAWCMEAIKCNALDYIKAIRNNLVGIDVSEYDDGVKEDSDD